MGRWAGMSARVLALMGLCWLLTPCAGYGMERDLYVSLPQKLPPGDWQKYLGEIGSDTLVTYRLGKDPERASTVSIVWMDELYDTRAMLQQVAPALKEILETKVHKGDKLVSEKMAEAVFGLNANDPSSLVVYFEFKHEKDTDQRKAGTYRYYYIYKQIDEKTSISLGVEVQILDQAAADPIATLLYQCGFRTPKEVAAEVAKAAPPATEKSPAPAGTATAPAPAIAPTTAPAAAPAQPSAPAAKQ
ncbi:MAG: hypothetical protein ACREJ2_05735 [Planctomycetota bacterium]